MHGHMPQDGDICPELQTRTAERDGGSCAGRDLREEPIFMADDNFEPLIIAFCCNWCSYAGADLDGVSRLQYPPNVRVIRVMCSGMVHPNLVIDALTKGADGVLICGCHPGDCHYIDGNLKADSRRAHAGGFRLRA